MIIHNRGWGPQLEDALFVDRITGHYRFQGPARPVSPTLVASARPNSIKPARGGTASMLVNRSRSTF